MVKLFFLMVLVAILIECKELNGNFTEFPPKTKKKKSQSANLENLDDYTRAYIFSGGRKGRK